MLDRARLWFDRVGHSALTQSGWPVDVALGVTVAALNVAGTVLPDPSVAYEYNDPHMVGLFVIAASGGLSLIWRRRYPIAVLFVCLAALSFVTWQGWQTGSMPGTVLFAVYAAGAWAPVRRGLVGLAGMYGYMGVMAYFQVPYFDSWIAAGSPVIFTLPWVVGVAVRHRRVEADRILARALELERDRVTTTERAVADERLRMARELHDVVTHTLSVIAVQSGVARHLLGPSDPAAGALVIIEDSSRLALDDLRRMLGVLRSRGEDAQLQPSPSIAELQLLVSAHRATHGAVQLVVDPDVERAAPSVRLTTYRLVQEALTNVGKHAPGAAARVTISTSPTRVVVEVEDDGAGRGDLQLAPCEQGYGLAGMRERVALFGGMLSTGPTDGGGYLMHAELCSEPVVGATQ